MYGEILIFDYITARCEVCAWCDAGIKRVALLDFDVHHGNGTEACVAATAPSLRKFSFKTPFSEGSQTFPTFSPWLDTDDADNILFARCAHQHRQTDLSNPKMCNLMQ